MKKLTDFIKDLIFTKFFSLLLSIIAFSTSLIILSKESESFIGLKIGDITLPLFGSFFGVILSLLITLTFIKFKPQLRVFVSYSIDDAYFVNKLVADLNKRRLIVVRATDILFIGDNIINKIEESINEVDSVIIIFSENSINSNFIPKEIEYANKQGKKIFPVVLDDTKIPINLSSIKYADFTNDYRQEFEYLVKSLHQNI